MIIWVDADACPKIIKEIIFKAANRTKTKTILVANQPLYTPGSLYIKSVVVKSGFDVADNYIVKNMDAGDLVITADVPLADDVITKNGVALNPRGQLYSKENIKAKLSMRDFGHALRGSGKITGGPDKITKKDLQAFANNVDRILSSTT